MKRNGAATVYTGEGVMESIMHRKNRTNTLYREEARTVWERYRPRALELPVGWTLLRDTQVCLCYKLRALSAALAVTAGLFAIQILIAKIIGVHEPVASPIVMLLEAVAAVALITPLAIIRFAPPDRVVLARLNKMAVIPLRRR